MAASVPPLQIGRVRLAGLLIVAGFFGGFGGWAALAPLDSAVVSEAVLNVEDRRKRIEHLEGGIVADVLVRDGDRVEAGEVVIRLDDTRARAGLDLLRGQRDAALALAARLVAERDRADAIAFPPELLDASARPQVRESIASQTGIFEARRAALQGQTRILRARIEQFGEEIRGLEAQIASESRQLALIEEEIADVSTLMDKGLARKERFLALQRRAAEIDGSRAQHQAMVARARRAIGEAELRIIELGTTSLNEAVAQLNEVQDRIADLSDRIRAAEDVLRRIDIRSPIDGIVVGLNVFSVGAVVGAGETLLEVVPDTGRLVVEARIEPIDIDLVRSGQSAQVRLTALDQRVTPTLEGKVTRVSADRLTDSRTGAAYYVASVELAPDGPVGRAALYPGMPAEVLIRTGERTLLEYLLKPLTGVVARGARET